MLMPYEKMGILYPRMGISYPRMGISYPRMGISFFVIQAESHTLLTTFLQKSHKNQHFFYISGRNKENFDYFCKHKQAKAGRL